MLSQLPETPVVRLGNVFKHIDHRALGLLRRVLNLDPEARPNTTEILLHPYFREVRRAPYHEPAFAEELRPDPRIGEFLLSKIVRGPLLV